MSPLHGQNQNDCKVKTVMNYVASADAVVALLPKGLQSIPYFDLGSAGHDGFDQQIENDNIIPIRFIRGGHGAGIVESQWDEIAYFVVEGKGPDLNCEDIQLDMVPKQHWLLKILAPISGISWLIMLSVFAMIIAVALALVSVKWYGVTSTEAATYAFILSGLIVALKSFLTKF